MALRARSLRSRLALTYAGMALLTALILGGILLVVLGGYYRNAEEAYLRASAEMLAADPPPLDSEASLAAWLRDAVSTTDTRVRVYDASHILVADSASSQRESLGVGGPGDGMGHEGRRSRADLPNPLGRRLFGGAADERSGHSITMAVGSHGVPVAYVQISEAPVSGADALVSAAQAWLVAAVLAVALAALVGAAVSRRISRPVVALTAASDRMAEGDLGARACVSGDDEVGRLGESFNAMAGRVEATVTTLRRFVADAAHELGTPLTALRADLELAKRAATTDDERRLIDRSLQQSQRLEDLSSGLLQLSRLESAVPGAEAADLAVAARAVAEAVASRAEQAGIEFSVEALPGPLMVLTGPGELQTVLGNLLDNAVKFTPEGGSVRLTIAREGATAVATVADTGVGIPLDEQAQIFSRFHRARNAAAYPGSGLGLAIVKAAVERAGGSVGFVSSAAGTTFRVTLPLA
jgi:signal transduction histidine kinase